MKRSFTLMMTALMLLTCSVTVWGQASVGTTLWSETWTGGDANEQPSAYGFEGTTVYGDGTLTYTNSSANTKLYNEALADGTAPELLLSKSNQTWTISGIPTGDATEMSLTFLSNKTAFDVTTTTTNISVSGSQKSWTITNTGNVTSFDLTLKNTSSSNARIDDITLIVTTAGSGGNSVATPTFSPSAGTYFEAQSVSISCATDGATIHYTTDGTEPTVESIVYTEPIAVSTTTTIKAFAVKAGMENSSVASATYTFPSVMTIAAARALENNEYALVEGIVTLIDGRNVYIQDATAGIDLYLNSNTVPTTLALGDKVRAYGKKAVFNGLIELTGIDGGDASQFNIVSNGNELPLTVKTIAEINADGLTSLQSTRVKVENATIGAISTSGNTTLTQGENTVNIYKIPALTGISEGDNVNVIAVVGCYNAVQLRVALAADVEKVGETQTVATPTFTPEEGTYTETQTVTINCETDGATIRYTLDGTDPTETSTEYTSALTISETTTVKAIAYKSGLNPSDIASATYTITPPAQETAYTLITGSNGLVAGDKYIVVGIKSDSYYALGKQNTNNRVSVAVTPEGNVITTTPATTSADETVYELTLGQDSVGYWTLYDAVNGGYLYAASSSSNYLKNQATNDANGVWTIDIAPNGIATIKAQGSNTRNWLRLNNSGTPFSCYGSGQLDVYLYKAGEIPPATIVATPTFTPGEGSYTEAQNVTISCETDGATIYYATDGTEPTVESTVYTEPIAVSTTTTIKAFAVKAGMENSGVATATYTFPSVITIAAARALENNEYALVEGIVTFIDSRNIYIQDETAGIDLYLNNNTVPETLALGDKVMAYGKKTVCNGLVELTGIDGGNVSQFSIVSNGNELPLAVKTIAEINADFAGSNMLQSTRVKIANGKIGAINTSGNTPMYQGENTINLYKMPVVEGLLENDSVTVIGIVGCFNAPQIRINRANDVEFTHPAGPSIAANPTQLTGFSYTFEEGPSAIQSFAVSGSNLTASATITASENFEISTTDGANFNAQSTITISENNFTNTSIYVRLKAGLEIGEYNETLVFASEGAETVNVTVSGNVAEPQQPSEYVQIPDLALLANGAKVILAARYNDDINAYFAMTATTSGKPEGVEFTRYVSENPAPGDYPTLPASIAEDEDLYYWTASINGGNYTFTNANGDVLGYTSGTNFSTGGDNTAWSIEYSTSDAAAMVPSYSAFVITNVNNNGRAIALNTSHNFGPYAKSNMTGSNAANYNFFLDIFATAGGTPICATPTITPASGTYYETQSVTISCATEGATIYYTTDGNEPTSESAVYTSPIEVSENMTIKAFASKEDYDDSEIATAEYTIILGATTIFAQDWEGEMNGWTFVTVEGSKPWTVASNSGNHYAYANGYNGGANEQWCISPAFNLDNYSDVTLSFRNAKNYDGPDMQFFISNNYDGNNPAAATWNELTYAMSTGSWNWVESGTISLDSYSGTNCHIGFKYTCTETEAAGWEVDDIIMVGFTSNPSLTATPTTLSGFGYMEGHGPSAEQSFVINGINLTSNVTISMVGTNFEMSATSGEAFVAQPTITLTPTAGAVNQTVYVRMTEGLAANTYVSAITVASQLDDITVSLEGTVTEEGDSWNRIFSVNDLENGTKVIVAARYNNVENEYFAMTATTSGKPEGVLFTSVTEGVLEILPDEIALDESTYSWTVSIENGNLTFTNAAGDVLGYGGSGTNFQTNGDNTNWNIDYVLSDPESMVPEYWGFLINNVNYTSRAFAINSTYHSYGPYSTQNMTGANASGYNFCVDLFVQGGEVTPTVMTPTFSMASGTYYEEIDVEISTSTAGATIHYTTDGTEPTAASAVYTNAIHVANNMTIKAIAMKEGYDNSNVATAEYVIMSDIVIIFNQDWEDGMNGWTFETFEGNKPWVIATYNNNQYANANGYGDDVDNEQWCISPEFNLNALAGQNPTLTFMNAMKFEGPDVELLFTNDYDGQDPTAATWHPLTFNHSSGNYEWVSSGEISLSQFSGSICNIAFKYTSTPEAAASWEIDDIMLYATPNTDPFIIPSAYEMTGFNYEYELGPSATQSFTLTAGNLVGNGVVTVTSSENFKLTLDEETWSNEISLEYADGQLVGQPVTVYVRMKCSLEIGTYEGAIEVSGGGAECRVTLSGIVSDHDGIAETIEENVSIYNSDDVIFIKNDMNSNLDLTMYNIVGQPVMSETVTTGDNRIEYNLTTGAYIIRLTDGSSVMSRKIVLR
ncbi:MAG: chitobiase/beta-hexosaminidase C-terminal domain-containing protein [Bacteroidales bacterium]|nr:chitobiase/beta-hexosaminidase C-terminal domain-containing protein [Bacteroidales bacterium]